MEITPFTVAVPEPERRRPARPRRGTRAGRPMSRPTGAAACPTRVRAEARRLLGGRRSTGAPRRPGSTRSRSSRPTSTASQSTSSTSARRFPARRRSSCSTATRARSSSRSAMIGPLVDPEAHGGRAEDAFHVVVPSLPGLRLLDAGDRTGLGDRGVRGGVRPDHAGARLRAVRRPAAATSAPGWPSSCASRPATGSSARSSSPIPARSRRSTRRRPIT